MSQPAFMCAFASSRPSPCPYALADLVPEAHRLGTDHALAMASWIVMTDADALSVLFDVDPAVLDQWSWPSLSGEWADSPTPDTLVAELGIDVYDPAGECTITCTDEVCSAWLEAADDVFADALHAVALRTLGYVNSALLLEHELEKRHERRHRG